MFQDPTTSEVLYGHKTNPVTQPPLPSEGVLQISGPDQVDVGVASSPFLVSFYGTIRGTIVVTLTFTGVAVTPSTTTFNLTAGSPIGSVTVTPSISGGATITASAAGLDSVSDSYTVISPLPVPDFDLWQYKIDPESAWGGPHGTNHLGDVCKPKINMEFDAADSDAPTTPAFINPVGFKITSALGTYDGSSGSPSQKTTMTATQLQHGQSTPTFPIVQRIVDPGGGGFMVFKHTHDRDQHYWVNNKKWRSQFVGNGTDVEVPWGTNYWFALSFRPTTDQLLSKLDGWDMIFQLHQGSSSRIRGGPLEFFLTGGNGNAAAARLWYWITTYENPNWTSGDYEELSGYIKKRQNSTILMGPAADTWHHIVCNVREGCGYADPVHGPIYGSVGPFGGGVADGSECFVKVWYAIGNGPAILAAPEWRGHWGGPHDPAHAAADENVLVEGVLTNVVNAAPSPGIYQSTPMLPASAGTQRTLIHRGVRAWIHQDGMTQHNVLEAFRGV